MAFSPTSYVPSEADRRIQWRWELAQSSPYFQFRQQWWRERDRILHQLGKERVGRRQTLPFDPELDLNTNAQNNVRNRWKEQGIWKDEWRKLPAKRWKHEEPPEREPQ